VNINFNPEIYKRTGWIPLISYLDFDGYRPRLIIRCATGRKYWPFFSEVIDPSLGHSDPALEILGCSFIRYTHPMKLRFKTELETMLSDIYGVEIVLHSVDSIH
jgi:hypothetical protein